MTKPQNQWDVIVVGAGAAGLMCAAQAGLRGRSVLVVDIGKRPGRKILISGGGRCNFTNYHISADNFLSNNPHFCKSALSQFTNWDFLSLIAKYKVAFHERDHGQLFCDDQAKDIVNLLLEECAQSGRVAYRYQTEITEVQPQATGGFSVNTAQGVLSCQSLVIASGGLSMPGLGVSPLGWRIAEQFGLKVIAPQAGLVPFTVDGRDKALTELTGTAVPVHIRCQDRSFKEALLFTHRGLSGPSVLQISSYWRPGEAVQIDWLPDLDLVAYLEQNIINHPAQELKTTLSRILPKRLVEYFIDQHMLENKPLRQLTRAQIQTLAQQLSEWSFKPSGTEGYRTAEVTLGGVDTDGLSSKTMQARDIPGLFFIGECVDVTGHLGGYNFQWAWSSGWVAGQHV